MSSQDPLTGMGDDLTRRRMEERAYRLWEEAGHPHGRADDFWFLAQAQIAAEEASYDEALEESFPASDPPARASIA